MTTIFPTSRICGLCRSDTEQLVMGSTTTFGSPDLDFRPPPLLRDSLEAWIGECPGCGYCAPDVSKRSRGAGKVVRGRRYREQLRGTSSPQLANRFLCWSMIQQEAGQIAEAGWAALHAAWVCDDGNGFASAAIACRRRSVELLGEAKARGQKFCRYAGEEDALLVDLFRRTNQMDHARRVCRRRLQQRPSKNARTILQFQVVLIESGDTLAHSVGEIIVQPRAEGSHTAAGPTEPRRWPDGSCQWCGSATFDRVERPDGIFPRCASCGAIAH